MVEAPRRGDARALPALELYAKIFHVDAVSKRLGESLEQRFERRQRESAPVVAELRRWLDERLRDVEPKSALGQALGYLNRQWPRLMAFLRPLIVAAIILALPRGAARVSGSQALIFSGTTTPCPWSLTNRPSTSFVPVGLNIELAVHVSDWRGRDPEGADMRYVFDRLQVDEDCRTVVRGAELVAIEPRVFDLLLYLIRYRWRAVSRSELVEHVWRGCVVGDSAIRHCVWSARRVVGESRAIRTVRPHGYQWVAPIHLPNDALDEAAPRSDRPRSERETRRP